MIPHLLGVTLALTSAAIFGSSDFCGGLATRRLGPFQVLVLSYASGILLMLGGAWLWREPLPSLPSLGWSTGAAIFGAVGVAALYRGLSLGHAARVAPTAAVIGAALPVLIGILADGLPGAARLAGFGLALPGLWLVSQPAAGSQTGTRLESLLGVTAGIGFGFFFIFIAQVESNLVFFPLAVARGIGLIVSIGFLLARQTGLPHPLASPTALLAGVLDSSGNVLYMFAKQYTRLDVAVVLTSLYPVITVLLSRLILKENVSTGQWAGAALCLAAIALITI